MSFLASWRSLVDISFTPRLDSLTGWSRHLIFHRGPRAGGTDEVRRAPQRSWGRSRLRLPASHHTSLLEFLSTLQQFPYKRCWITQLVFRKRRKQRRRSSGSSTDLVMESRRPSKRSCRIHRRGLGPAAAHPSGPTGSTPPTRFPSATDTSVLCSGPLPRSHRRDCGNVINSLTHRCHSFWKFFLPDPGCIPLLCALMTSFSPSQHFSHF